MLRIVVILMLSLPIFGCKLEKENIDTTDFSQTSELISGMQKKTDTSQKDLSSAADGIGASADKIVITTKEPSTKIEAEKIQSLNTIVRRVAGVDLQILLEQFKTLSAQNDVKDKSVEALKETVAQKEKQIEEQKKENEKIQQENRGFLNTILMLIVAACVVSVGISIFMILSGMSSRIGMAILGAAVITGSLSAAFISMWKGFVVAGMTIAGIVVCFIGWQIFSLLRQLIQQKKELQVGLEEVVDTVETIKPILPPEKKQEIFHGPVIDELQSPKTKQLVEEAKMSLQDWYRSNPKPTDPPPTENLNKESK